MLYSVPALKVYSNILDKLICLCNRFDYYVHVASKIFVALKVHEETFKYDILLHLTINWVSPKV